MASAVFYLALLSASILPALVISVQKCPFNQAECDCSDSSSTTDFDYANCTSQNLMVPHFAGNANFTISDQLELVFSAYLLPSNAFTAFKKISFLSLIQPASVGSQPAQWSSGAFNGPQISGLSVFGVRGVLPPPIALGEIGKSLEALHFINCGETVTLPANKFSKFTQLKYLVIADTPIGAIDYLAFSGLQNLGELWLQNTNLGSFPTAAVKGLTNLYRIDISNSKVKYFTRNDFVPFTELVFLILDGNDIGAAVNSGALLNVPKSVTTLFLRAGTPPLTAVPASVIANAPQVTILSLANNAITSLNVGDFPKGTEIISLDLSSNPITSIQLAAFQYLSNVYNLFLADTKLTSFDFTVLNGMSSLLTLDVSDSSTLTSLIVTNISLVPHTLSSIKAKKTKLATIDPKLDEILGQKYFRTLDISDVDTITCDSNVYWLAKYVLCQPVRVWAPNTKCSGGRSLADFLSTVVDNPCATPTPGIPTSGSAGPVTTGISTGPPQSTVSGATGVPTVPSGPPATTKAASSVTANIVLTFTVGAVITLVKSI